MKELKSMSPNESYEWIAFERLPNVEKKRAGAWRCVVPSWEACVCVCHLGKRVCVCVRALNTVEGASAC